MRHERVTQKPPWHYHWTTSNLLNPTSHRELVNFAEFSDQFPVISPRDLIIFILLILFRSHPRGIMLSQNLRWLFINSNQRCVYVAKGTYHYVMHVSSSRIKSPCGAALLNFNISWNITIIFFGILCVSEEQTGNLVQIL